MQRIECPVCQQEGRLQWKKTVTTAQEKKEHYNKLYV